jgi:hypothetical protein
VSHIVRESGEHPAYFEVERGVLSHQPVYIALSAIERVDVAVYLKRTYEQCLQSSWEQEPTYQ